MKNYKLFSSSKVGAMSLKNHIVMAPMSPHVKLWRVAIQREFKHDMDELGKLREGLFKGNVT